MTDDSDWFVQVTVTVYTRPSPCPVRAALRFTVKGLLICQSTSPGDRVPSLLSTALIKHPDTVDPSRLATWTDTARIVLLGGQRTSGDADKTRSPMLGTDGVTN